MAASKEEPQYGYLSIKQAKFTGTAIYLDTNGKEVEVTDVSKRKPDDYLKDGWKDKKFVGMVTTFKRRGQNQWLTPK